MKTKLYFQCTDCSIAWEIHIENLEMSDSSGLADDFCCPQCRCTALRLFTGESEDDY